LIALNHDGEAMSDQPEPKSKRSILSSPLTNVIVSFILTSVIGTAITQFYFDRRQAEQLRITQQQDRKEALTIFLQHMKENHIRFELLVEALANDAASEEASELKHAHDESWIAWRRERPHLLFLTKDLLSRSEYERFLEVLESQLEEGMIAPIRRCLHDAFSEAGAADRVKELLEDCNVNGQVEKAVDCIDALFNELHEISAVPSNTKPKISDERRAELAKQVDQACATGL